jgi:Glycosyltransferase family 87
MRVTLRTNAACLALAAAGCLALAWLGLYGYGWNDYENEALPAVTALVHGHLGDFLRLAPAYGGSLVERAPFALLPGLWGGGDLAVYRMLALPCLVAAGVLGVWLVARMRAEDRPRLARGVALGLCVANPVMLPALELGHAEEVLGACLVVGAVLFASDEAGRSRPLVAGAALGLAVANKQWALLAVGPVLLAVPPGLRLRCLAMAAAVVGVLLAPLLLFSSSFVASTKAVASPGASPIFQPWQAWWFLGHHGALVHGLYGTPKPGYRVAPQWMGTVARPLVVLCGAVIAAALWLRRRRLSESNALLTLTVVLLLRCMLDTWDVVYYTVPFVMALLVWEVRTFAQRPPVMSLLTAAVVWVNFEWLPHHASADTGAAVFLCWSLVLLVWLARKLVKLAAVGPGARQAPAARVHAVAVRSLGRRVSTSLPFVSTTSRSSIRTPSSLGR